MNLLWVLVVGITVFIILFLIPLITVYRRAKASGKPVTKRIGTIRYRASVDPSRGEVQTRIIIGRHPVLGINRHGHRFAQGKVVRSCSYRAFNYMEMGSGY